MVFVVGAWAILIGAWADQTWLAQRIPKLPEWLAPLRDKIPELGLASIVVGALIVLRAFVGFLGLLGLPFDGLLMFFWLWYVALAPVLLALGVAYGTARVRDRINDSRKEAALVRLSEGLSRRVVPLGRAAWAGGLVLMILALIV